MKAVVLAAGRGTRMQELTAEKPKALVEVAGEPLLNYPLDLLTPSVEGFVVVVGYHGSQIIGRYGDSYRGVPVTYARQPSPEGRADALLQAEPHVDGDFVVVNGDNVFSPHLEPELTDSGDATLFVEEVSLEEARGTGVCRFDDDRLDGVVEKHSEPPSTVAVTGLYRFSEQVFSYCRDVEPSNRGEKELTEAVDRMIRDGLDLKTERLSGWRVNVNTPGDVRRVEARLNR